MEVYRRIFERASNTAEVRRAIARAVRELRAAMEKEDNPAVTRAHVRGLDDVDAECLARAYALAEKTCVFWPSPGEIRELAGWSEAARAEEALERVFRYLEEHGVEGRPKGGAVTFGENESGQRVVVANAAVVPAPELGAAIEKTLISLGSGSRRHGLLYAGQHPRVKGWDERGGDSSKTAERIERQWMRYYRNQLHGGTNENGMGIAPPGDLKQ